MRILNARNLFEVTFRTEEEAEEKTSEYMMRALERKCKVEVKDLNWREKGQYNLDSYNSCMGWRNAEEKINSLEAKMDALKKGWRDTFETAGRWLGHMLSFSVSDPEDVFLFVLNEGIASFENLCGKKYVM